MFFRSFFWFRRNFLIDQSVLHFSGNFLGHLTGVRQSGGISGDLGTPTFPGITGGCRIAGRKPAAIRFDASGRPLDILQGQCDAVFIHLLRHQIGIVGSKAGVCPSIVYPIRITLSAAFLGGNSGSIQREFSFEAILIIGNRLFCLGSNGILILAAGSNGFFLGYSLGFIGTRQFLFVHFQILLGNHQLGNAAFHQF